MRCSAIEAACILKGIEPAQALAPADIQIGRKAGEAPTPVGTDIKQGQVTTRYGEHFTIQVTARRFLGNGEQGTQLLVAIPIGNPGELCPLVFGVTTGHQGAGRGDNRRVVARCVARQLQGPVADGQRIEKTVGNRITVPVVLKQALRMGVSDEIAQTQRAIHACRITRLIFAGTWPAQVVGRDRGREWQAGRIGDTDNAFTGFRTRQDFHCCVVRRQPIKLVQPLLDVTQIERLALDERKGHCQIDAMLLAALEQQALDPTFNDQYLKPPATQVLGLDIRPDADIAAINVFLEQVSEQLLDIFGVKAFPDKRGCQLVGNAM